MAFRWQADDGQFLVVFGSSLPHYLKKTRQSWTLSGKTFWIRACYAPDHVCVKLFLQMRKLHTLNKKDKIFLVLATMTLLTLVPITIHRMNSNDKGFADFTFGIILLLNMGMY